MTVEIVIKKYITFLGSSDSKSFFVLLHVRLKKKEFRCEECYRVEGVSVLFKLKVNLITFYLYGVVI